MYTLDTMICVCDRVRVYLLGLNNCMTIERTRNSKKKRKQKYWGGEGDKEKKRESLKKKTLTIRENDIHSKHNSCPSI